MTIRQHPCCTCPALQSDFREEVCDKQTTFLDKAVEPCNFLNTFKDDRGWLFFVRGGLGENNYKTFFKKPGQNTDGHGYSNLPWRKSFREAQEDLNKLAIKKGWVTA